MKQDNQADLIAHLERAGRRHLVGHAGEQVCWREFGAGAPLVLLHGGHGSWLHWIRNIEALAASHRVLLPDLPGYGDSDALPAQAGFAALVDALAASIDQLLGRGTAFDLAGFSFGGVVAGQIAQRRDSVRKLALLGAVGHGRRRRQTAALRDWRDAPDHEAMMATLAHNLSALMLHRPVDPLALEIHHRCCVGTRYHSKRTSLSPLLSDTLAQLALPVLMLWGEHDPTGDPDEVGPLWQGGHAERESQVVRAAGHWVQYEAAGEVNRRLLDWFAAPPEK